MGLHGFEQEEVQGVLRAADVRRADPVAGHLQVGGDDCSLFNEPISLYKNSRSE